MANKKITVVGDGAEEPLSPEEEHRIEVKVDQMLDLKVPESTPTQTKTAQKPEPTTESKSTKIVSTFADEPAVQPKALEPAPKPKPAAKKIAVQHHDEETVEAPKKPTAKHANAKAPAKELKVTIADGSEPEELTAKADAITAAALAAEEQLSTPELKVEDSADPAVEEPEAVAEETLAESNEPSDDSAQGAPPLIQKHKAAPIAITAEPEPEAVEPPKPSAKKISVLHDESDEQAVEPEAAESPVETVEETVEEPVEIPVEELPEETEAIQVEVEDSEPAKPESEPEAGKYRPPDGPLQFKRAEVPIQPHKPGEPRSDTPPADELTEDEAIAQAFETKSGNTSDTARRLVGGLLKLVKWTFILAVIGGIIAVGVLPTLRHKALSLVGIDTKTQGSTTKAQAVDSATGTTDQDVYITKRAGVYNLYRAKLDGQDEQLVLAGTGKETSDVALAPNASGAVAALVSTRDGKQGASGDTQQSLTLVTIGTGATTVTDTADQIKLIDWFGDRIVYVIENTSTSTSDTNRYQLISYDVAAKTRTVLDHATYLNDVLSAQGTIYYATATTASASGQFSSIRPDGKGKKVILSSEVAAITRTGYDTVLLSTVTKWYSYELGSVKATTTNSVGQGGSRRYVDSPDGKHSVYLNTDEDSSELKLVDTATGKETAVAATNASYPIHWLGNDTVIYRSNGADYSLKLDGQPAKIADVFDSAGISLWHKQ